MLKHFNKYCVFILVVVFLASFGQKNVIHASEQPSIVRGNNGVMYLSTTITATPPASNSAIKHTPEPDAIPAAKIARRGTPARFALAAISLPIGFYTNLADLINQMLRIVFLLATLLVFLQLILAGFNWITSGGDRGKVEQARSRIIAAILGLIVVSASYAILTIVLQFLGFESLDAVFSRLPHQ